MDVNATLGQHFVQLLAEDPLMEAQQCDKLTPIVVGKTISNICILYTVYIHIYIYTVYVHTYVPFWLVKSHDISQDKLAKTQIIRVCPREWGARLNMSWFIKIIPIKMSFEWYAFHFHTQHILLIVDSISQYRSMIHHMAGKTMVSRRVSTILLANCSPLPHAGYIDVTAGVAYEWACAHYCVGGQGSPRVPIGAAR